MPLATGYGRESMGSAQSIKEQSRLFFARAAAEGWEVAGWFEDQVSASSYGRKKGIARDAWPEVRKNLTEILWLNESDVSTLTLTASIGDLADALCRTITRPQVHERDTRGACQVHDRSRSEVPATVATATIAAPAASLDQRQDSVPLLA